MIKITSLTKDSLFSSDQWLSDKEGKKQLVILIPIVFGDAGYGECSPRIMGAWRVDPYNDIVKTN